MLTSHWFGAVHWTLAAPLRRRFLPTMLCNAGGEGSEVHDLLKSGPVKP